MTGIWSARVHLPLIRRKRIIDRGILEGLLVSGVETIVARHPGHCCRVLVYVVVVVVYYVARLQYKVQCLLHWRYYRCEIVSSISVGYDNRFDLIARFKFSPLESNYDFNFRCNRRVYILRCTFRSHCFFFFCFFLIMICFGSLFASLKYRSFIVACVEQKKKKGWRRMSAASWPLCIS